ncbi:MAG: methyltransferase domain-containing protein [Planctomycetes bacterium]|nr:methyltransferase domain-containing protein [Planctomycetota bacterium]
MPRRPPRNFKPSRTAPVESEGPKVGKHEKEFGVPIPGAILPQEYWTQTALKEWPADGLLNWEELFGRKAPVVADLGCGNGRYLLGSSLYRPQFDHLGVDILPVVIRYARRRGNQRGFKNLRFAVGEERVVLEKYIPPGSLHELHVYHPQPYYDPGEIHKRQITPRFLWLAHRALEPGGLLVLQTDHPAYWKYMLQVAPIFFEFQAHPEPWEDAPRGRTRREILARKRGLQIFRGLGRARKDLDPAEAQRRAEALPPPVFNADRRLIELDRMERV